jgi:hypothetical protein
MISSLSGVGVCPETAETAKTKKARNATAHFLALKLLKMCIVTTSMKL